MFRFEGATQFFIVAFPPKGNIDHAAHLELLEQRQDETERI